MTKNVTNSQNIMKYLMKYVKMYEKKKRSGGVLYGKKENETFLCVDVYGNYAVICNCASGYCICSNHTIPKKCSTKYNKYKAK